MVFKFVILCASLAVANAGLTAIAPVATYSSAPSVSYSTFSSPLHTNTISYAAAAPAIATTLHHAQPLAYSSAPAVATVYNSAYSHPATSIISAPAVGSTHQSTVRSFGGTVSHHSKAVDTAFSSVRQSDTRSSNNVYTPALAATTYAASAPAIHTTYSAAPSAAIYEAPKTLTYSSSPLVAHVSFDGLGTHYAF